MDTVKNILEDKKVVTVDTTSHDVVAVDEIPPNPESFLSEGLNPRQICSTAESSKFDNLNLLKLYCDVLTSGKIGFVFKCSILQHKESNQFFVHVLPSNWSSHSVFTFVPTFQIICNLKHEIEGNKQDCVKLVMNMVPFIGEPLVHQSETLTVDGLATGEEVKETSMVKACANSKLLKLFSEGRFELCQGVANCQKIKNTLRSYGMQVGNY